MPNLTLLTSFTGEIYIPNVDKTEVAEELQGFIDKYEPQFLRKVLGVSLYNSFAGRTLSPEDTKWTELINGKDYINSYGHTVTYEGLKPAIANYIYYWYQRNKATETSGIGEVVNKPENAVRASAAGKMVRAWNEMVEIIWQLRSFLNQSTAIYTDWTYRVIRCDEWSKINSLNI